MAKTVFIFNSRQYMTTLGATEDVEVEDDTGKKRILKQKVLEKSFPVFVKAPDTGSILHTGYTQLTDEEYKTFLKGSKIFASYIKNGQFRKHDDAPPEALLDSEMLDRLKATNVDLEEKVAALEGLLVSGEDKKTKKMIADLEAENSDLKAQIILLESDADDAEVKETEAEAPKGLF